MKRVIYLLSTIAVITAMVLINIGSFNESKHTQAPYLSERSKQQVIPATNIDALLKDANTPSQLTQQQPLPRSLIGLKTPMTLDIDSYGDLIINNKIIKLFDFYLTAIGEEPLESIIERVRLQLANTLSSKAFTQAFSLFENYIRYLNQLTVLKSSYSGEPQSIATIAQAKAQVHQLRTQFFSPQQIDVFWGKYDQYERYMLTKVTINSNPTLSAQQKAHAINELDNNAPSWLISQRQQTTQLNDYREQHQALINQGADTHQINELIRQQFNPQAAERLVALQHSRQQWQHRLSQYRNELDLLLSVETDNITRDEQIAALREDHFSEQEIKRINALDSTYIIQRNKEE